MPKHYPCPGPELCPLGILHPPNIEAVNGSHNVASFVIGCLACAGFQAEEEHLSFNPENEFGFPVRDWLSFNSTAQILEVVSQAELRARLQARHPLLAAAYQSADAEVCAELLLAFECCAQLDVKAEEEAATEKLQEAADRLLEAELQELCREERAEQIEKMFASEIAQELQTPHQADVCAELKANREARRASSCQHHRARCAQRAANMERLVRSWKRGKAPAQRRRGGRRKLLAIQQSELSGM